MNISLPALPSPQREPFGNSSLSWSVSSSGPVLRNSRVKGHGQGPRPGLPSWSISLGGRTFPENAPPQAAQRVKQLVTASLVGQSTSCNLKDRKVAVAPQAVLRLLRQPVGIQRQRGTCSLNRYLLAKPLPWADTALCPRDVLVNGPHAALNRQMVWAVNYTSVVLPFKKVVTVMRAVGEEAECHE